MIARDPAAVPAGKPLPLVAHRGNTAQYPENTLASIGSALALNLRYVEFDVQIAADGVPVVIHDVDLQRTGGHAAGVFTSTAAALAAGPVHEPDRFGERFAGTTVPTLAQMVDLIATAPAATAFIELKRASIVQHGLAVALAAVLRVAAPIRDQSVIISFSLEAIAQALHEGWRTGAVLTAYDADMRTRIEALRPEFVFCNHEKLPPDDSPLWPGPWRWALYEITDVALAKRLRLRGAELFETMQVAAMSAALTGATWLT